MEICWNNLKFHAPKLDNNTKSAYVEYKECIKEKKIPKYIAIIDLETDGLIYQTTDNKEKIPNITELGILVIKTKDFLTQKNVSKITIELKINIKNYTNREFILKIIEINNIYKPLFVAHNGYIFDYKIILYYILFEKLNTETFCLYDSYIAAKNNITTVKRFRNIDLFMHYIEHYKDNANLIHHAHEAYFDCLMLYSWLHAAKDQLNFAKYYNDFELLNLFDTKKKIKTVSKNSVTVLNEFKN